MCDQKYYWIVRTNGDGKNPSFQEDWGPYRNKGTAYWRVQKLIYAFIYSSYKWNVLFGTFEEIGDFFNVLEINVPLLIPVNNPRKKIQTYTREELLKLK